MIDPASRIRMCLSVFIVVVRYWWPEKRAIQIAPSRLYIWPNIFIEFMLKIRLRKYESGDRDACIGVFNSNVPHFLAHQELAEFLDYLDSGPPSYWVLVESGQVIGCGGFGQETDDSIVSLHWGLIGSAWHGKRIGELLLLARVIEAIKTHTPDKIRIATSQHTQSFFGKYGFAAEQTTKDGFADGIDLIEMYLTLTSASISAIDSAWERASNLLEHERPEDA